MKVSRQDSVEDVVTILSLWYPQPPEDHKYINITRKKLPRHGNGPESDFFSLLRNKALGIEMAATQCVLNRYKLRVSLFPDSSYGKLMSSGHR
jgi:hypothetical protein